MSEYNFISTLNDWSFKIRTGSRSQTVNRFPKGGPEGDYEAVYRIASVADFFTNETWESMVSQLGNQTPEEIEKQLLAIGAQFEGPRKAGSKPITIPTDTKWGKAVEANVYEAIEELICRFLRYPQMHRVEHSLHCELYQILIEREVFSGFQNVGKTKTRLVQKEWPEVRPSGESSTRGQYDLSILAPGGDSSSVDFRFGRIVPAFAIELGLNYGKQHLANDYEKLKVVLKDSVKGILVHFANAHSDQSAVEALSKDILKEKKVDIAFVVERSPGDFLVRRSW